VTKAAPPLGVSRDQYHRYVWNDGQTVVGPLPSVTTVLKLQDIGGTDGLIRWAAGLAVDYALRAPADPDVRKNALEESGRPAAVGTDVHDQVRRIIVGEPILPNPDTVFHLAHFAAFLGKERPKFLMAEEFVVNLDLRYGGQFDFIAELRDRVALVDVKTGKDRPAHKLQLAGYLESEFVARPESTERVALPAIDATYVLFLSETGYELVEKTVTPADRTHFRFLAETYHKVAAWKPLETVKEEAAA
jgi:hypothetical protein